MKKSNYFMTSIYMTILEMGIGQSYVIDGASAVWKRLNLVTFHHRCLNVPMFKRYPTACTGHFLKGRSLITRNRLKRKISNTLINFWCWHVQAPLPTCINEECTHSKGEQAKIPLLLNKVGKRSGTMTMVTTDIIAEDGRWKVFRDNIFLKILLDDFFLYVFSWSICLHN